MELQIQRLPSEIDVEPFDTIFDLINIIESGVLPDNTRILQATKEKLLGYAARALAVARDERSIEFDLDHAMDCLFKHLGDYGFFGEESRF